MSRTRYLAKGVIFLNLAVLLILTFEQLREQTSLVFIFGLLIRLAILCLLGWKTLSGSKPWYIGIAMIFVLEAALIYASLYRHSHPGTFVIFRVGGNFVSRAQVISLLCILPFMGAFAAGFLAREAARLSAKPSPKPAGDTAQR